MKIKKIEKYNDSLNFYDITVADNHNFLLESGVLAHNCGTGVGFSVENAHVDKLPEVPEQLFNSDTTIVVSDSKEGWAKGLRQLIALLYSGEIPKWDFSKIRPAGARLKTFGGRASGPGPLDNLFNFCVDIFKKAKGRKLTSLECHDIVCKIAEVVIVGSVRRSALISLSDLNDKRLREAKTGEWWRNNPQRALSNNSASYHSKPEIGDFMDEWVSIYKSHSGERGIFNHYAIKKHLDKLGRKYVKEMGSNPSLASGTRVWTTEGIFEIQDLEGKEFVIRNRRGSLSKANCWLSSENASLIQVEVETGICYKATPEHKWPCLKPDGIWEPVPTEELKPGDKLKVLREESVFPGGSKGSYLEGFVIGWNLGDGWSTTIKTSGKTQYGFIVEEKDKESGIDCILTDFFQSLGVSTSLMDKKEINISNEKIRNMFESYGFKHKHLGLPTAVWNSEVSDNFRKGIIDGLFSSDGSVGTLKDRRINLTAGSKGLNLLKDVSDLLGFFGISCQIHSKYNYKSNFGIFDRHTLRIGGKNNIQRFNKLFKLSNKYKQKALENIARYKYKVNKFKEDELVTVKSVKHLENPEPVWDISVEDSTHSFQLAHCVTGNCSEIILNSNQFCNLTTVVVKPTDTFDEIKNKIKLATILGTYQAKFVDFPYLRKVWRKQTESEALLGVSMTGIFDNPLLSDLKDPELPNRLEELKKIARETNEYWAPIFNVNVSAAITCIKPEGTTSQLCNVSSGLHGQHSKYYFRTIRSDNKDPLTKFLKDNGVYNEPCVHYPDNTTIFYFGKKAPSHSILREDLTAVEHLELWLLYQRHYCEHKPSVTINVKEHEWLEVGSWVYKNWDEMTGVSFLPYDGGTYKQAPYQEIDEETYNKFIETQPTNLDWDLLIEHDDNVEGVQQLSCTSGQCEL